MGNQNRIHLLSMLGAPIAALVAILFNFYGSAQFRDAIFIIELLITGAGMCVAFWVRRCYLSVWYVEELRITIIWKCVGALYIIFTNLWLVERLLVWMYTKGYNAYDIQIDQQWSTWQLVILLLFIGANFDSLIDFDNILYQRLKPFLDVPRFGEVGLELNKLTEDDLALLDERVAQWEKDLD